MTKILVVDDSPTEMARFREVLTKNNLTILEATTGGQGIQMAIDEQPDLVLMDVVMPEMNGFQATRKITRNKATSHIPVVIVSTKNQETDRVWGKRQGAKEYLTKPFNESELLQVIQRVKLKGGSQAAGALQSSPQQSQQTRPKQETVRDIRAGSSSQKISSNVRVQATVKKPSPPVTGNVTHNSIANKPVQSKPVQSKPISNPVQNQQVAPRVAQDAVTAKPAPKPVAPKPVVPKPVESKPAVTQPNPKPDDADDNGIYL